MKRDGLLDYVTPLPGYSEIFAHQWDKSIDFIFIDGSHSYQPVFSDFMGFFPWVKDHGVVAFHDIGSCTGPMRVWQEMAKHLLYDIGFCGGVAFGRKRPAKALLNKIEPVPSDSLAKYHTRVNVLPQRRQLQTVEYNSQTKCNTLPAETKAHKVLIVHLVLPVTL